jgi:hypothetical protein
MRIDHKLEPLMQLKLRTDNIQVYGCYQVGFNFMLKTDIEVPMTVMQEFVPKMMKAACDAIEAYNKEQEAISLTSSDTVVDRKPDLKSCLEQPEKS